MARLLFILPLLAGCSFTLSDINTGASVGRTFDAPFSTGKNTYTVTISGHYTRDK